MAEAKGKGKEKEREKAPDEKKEKEPAKPQDKKPLGNKPIIIGIIAGVIIIEAIMLFLLLRVTKPPSADDVDAKMKEDSLKQTMTQQTNIGAVLETPIEAVVNIAGTDGMRFLKVIIVLEYDNQQYQALGVELGKRTAKLKDMLIEMLSSMTLEELNRPDVRTQIRKEYMRAVNNSLPAKTGQISNVYLNEFIIQ